ncbi:MAG: glutamate formimidoyltransferase [Fimbriimonadaceae bacterium]|nr:glutamate formimidoyltransferase [Chthonomonadaceae bacterium]MCO5296231.1 glutamate formimidoyltransferase [Fimbriimonadaceae bacterium]
MSEPLIECVPNFSEGRDPAVIQAIADAVSAVEGATLLNVDPGKSTNRTVFTFAGAPEAVCEAAFQAAKVGSERIDMARHSGEHPRFGAMDVCPLIPISGISMEEVAEHARALGKRLGKELGLSIFLYGEAATSEERKELSSVRAGEYEALPERLKDPRWKPDFGPATFQPKTGATAVGARDFLIAYNVNLNTTSARRANAVAFDIRERGRVKREGDPLTGEIVRDAEGHPVYEPGALKSTKAIGWFIEEYGFAQVSINLTNLRETPLHTVYEVCCEKAGERGMRVTGSELVGLVPLEAMLAAGRHFLKKQQRSTGLPNDELIRIAVKTMGLDELDPFDPQERIIEYAMRDRGLKNLVDLDVRQFAYTVASESPAPGGGSVAALAGALGAALGTMVANLSSHKRGWDARWEEFSDWAERGQACCDELLRLVDEDTRAFDRLMAAFKLPKGTDEEQAARHDAIQRRTEEAMQVPLQTMEVALRSMEVLEAMAAEGNPNSVSDAGVGALCARAAVRGAHLNVQINSSGVEDKAFVDRILARAAEIDAEAAKREEATLALVRQKMDA